MQVSDIIERIEDQYDAFEGRARSWSINCSIRLRRRLTAWSELSA
jgi:hypothetical protein